MELKSSFSENIRLASYFIKNQIVSFLSLYILQLSKIFKFLGFYIIVTSHIDTINYINIYLVNNLLWIFYGILSSIGFGTGFHTGILFLFPHVNNIYNTAVNCNSTNFYQYSENAFICLDENNTILNTNMTIEDIKVGEFKNINFYTHILHYDIFVKALPAVFCWGLGTALGEVPPYFMATAINNKVTFESFFKGKTKYCLDIIVRFLLKYSFITIVIMASWPNATFDMCGMACGFYKISIYKFLTATIIGKAFIKAPTQLFLFVYCFSGFVPKIESDNLIITIWKLCVTIATLYFSKECIDLIADKQRKILKK